jgi:hypothetical protein
MLTIFLGKNRTLIIIIILHKDEKNWKRETVADTIRNLAKIEWWRYNLCVCVFFVSFVNMCECVCVCVCVIISKISLSSAANLLHVTVLILFDLHVAEDAVASNGTNAGDCQYRSPKTKESERV